jgi:sensor histidine kinase YesM
MNAALLIEMTNPYIPGDKGRRWKPHGLGLKNVAYVVEKYDGDLKRDIREGDYFVSIIFP